MSDALLMSKGEKQSKSAFCPFSDDFNIRSFTIKCGMDPTPTSIGNIEETKTLALPNDWGDCLLIWYTSVHPNVGEMTTNDFYVLNNITRGGNKIGCFLLQEGAAKGFTVIAEYDSYYIEVWFYFRLTQNRELEVTTGLSDWCNDDMYFAVTVSAELNYFQQYNN